MIAIVGCGALGSRIAIEMFGQELLLWDDDVVSEENIPVSSYARNHIGMRKAVALSEMCARRGIRSQYIVETLTERNRRRLHGMDLVVDALDNTESRMLLAGLSCPTLHVGVSANRSGSILWDEGYRVPDEGFARGQNPVCTHALGAPIIRMVSVVAVQIIDAYYQSGEKRGALVVPLGVVVEK